MPTAPRVLKNFNLFVNGRGKAGMLDEYTPPEIKVKTEDARYGGLDADIEVDMGMEKLKAKFKLADPDPDTLVLVGLSSGNSARVVVKGAFRRDSDGEVIQVVHELVGRIPSRVSDAWKAGDKTANEFDMTLTYYKETVGGREIYEIDIENMIRRVDGVDQLADIRAAMGL